MQTFFLTIPRLVMILTKPLSGERFLLVFKLIFLVLMTKLFHKTVSVKLVANKSPYDFNMTLHTYEDFCVIKELFVDREYEWFPTEFKTIIDLGAHIGDTALYYHAHFPEATIVAIEPGSDNFQRLVKNTEGIDNIKTVQTIVGESDGRAELHIMPGSLGNTTKADAKELSTEVVRQVTLRTLLSENGITKADLIKFDIEGSEFAVFEDIRPEAYANAYIGEIHEGEGNETLETFVSYFTPAFTIETRPTGRKGRHLFMATIKK